MPMERIFLLLDDIEGLLVLGARLRLLMKLLFETLDYPKGRRNYSLPMPSPLLAAYVLGEG